MYIRTKTRTNKSGKTYTYAYLAEMHQVRSKPRQKVKKYLGRVYKPEKMQSYIPTEWPSTLHDMLEEMVKMELRNHGFKENEQKKWKNNVLKVDLAEYTVKNVRTGRKASIQLNQGIMCDETLKRVLNYTIPKENIKTISKDFSKVIVEAGIQAPDRIIVEAFRKIQTMINNKQQWQTMEKQQKTAKI